MKLNRCFRYLIAMLIFIVVVMIVILMYRPSGLTKNRELVWPSNKLSDRGKPKVPADGKTA